MYCGHCGKANADAARFCVYCGQTLAELPPAHPPIGAPPEEGKQAPGVQPLAERPAAAFAKSATPTPVRPEPGPSRPAGPARRSKGPAIAVGLTLAAFCVAGLVLWGRIAQEQQHREARRALLDAQRLDVQGRTREAADRYRQAGQDPEVKAEAMRWLLARLTDEQERDRDAVGRYLSEVDPDWPRGEAAREAVPRLIAAAEAGSAALAADAMRALGDIGDRRALTPLLRILASGGRRPPRPDRVGQSDEQAERRMRDDLMAALDRIEPQWRTCAEAADLRLELLTALHGRDASALTAAVEGLQEIGDRDAIVPLLRLRLRVARSEPPIAGVDWDDLGFQQAILDALDGIDPKWADGAEARSVEAEYLAALSAAGTQAKRIAAETLRRIAGTQAAPALLRALLAAGDDTALATELQAALDHVAPRWPDRDLARTLAPECIRMLSETATGRQQLAMRILAKAADPAAIGPLLLVRVRGHPLLYLQAGRTLDAIRTDWPASDQARAQVPALIETLRSRTDRHKREAAGVLALIGDPRAIEPLTAMLDEPAQSLRTAAGDALVRCAGTVPAALAERLLSRRETDCTGAAALMQRIDGNWTRSEPVRALRARMDPMLQDADAQVRLAAVRALCYVDAAAAPDRLMPLMEDADPGIRQAVCRVAGESRHAAAAPALVVRLADPSETVSVEAAKALRKLDAAAWPSDEQVRNLAPSVARTIQAGSGAPAEAGKLLIGILAKAGGTQIVPPLAGLLRAGDRTVRLEAAKALGNTQTAEAIPPLIAAVPDADPEVSRRVQASLRYLDSRWSKRPEVAALIPRLVAAVQQNALPWHMQAVELLGELRRPDAVEGLLDIATNDADDKLREKALWSLGVIGSPRAFEGVVALLKDRVAPVRHAAIDALERIDGPRRVQVLLDILNAPRSDDNDAARKHAITTLGGIGGPEAFAVLLSAAHQHADLIPTFREALFDYPDDARLREPMLEALLVETDPHLSCAIVDKLRRNRAVDLREPAFARATLPRLRESAASPSPAIHLAAVLLAISVDPAASSDIILKALDDKDAEARRAVVDALSIHPGPADEAVRQKVVFLLTDPDIGIRRQAARMCDWFHIRPAVPAEESRLQKLIADLASDQWYVREATLDALGALRDRRATAALLRIVEGDRPDVQCELTALGRIGDPDAVDPLIEMLVAMKRRTVDVSEALDEIDPNWVKRPAGQKAVTTLIEDLRPGSGKRMSEVLPVLGQCRDPRAARALDALLSDPNPPIRREVVRALWDIADPGSVEPLTGVLDDPDGIVRDWAAQALGSIGDGRAAGAILERLREEPEPKVATSLLYALRHIGKSNEGLRLMPDLLAEPDPMRRWVAVLGFGLLGGPQEVTRVLRTLCMAPWPPTPEGKAPIPMKSMLPHHLRWERSQEAAEAIDDLVGAAAGEPGPARDYGVTALTTIRNGRAVAPLLAILDDPRTTDDEFLRVLAALDEIGAPEALAGLEARVDRLEGMRQHRTRQTILRSAYDASRAASAPAGP